MKRAVSYILVLSLLISLCSCDSNDVVESSETIESTSETSVTTEVSETEVVNPNGLPVYEDIKLISYSSVLDSDIVLDDEAISELLDVSKYPFRASYGFGFDSFYTTEYITEFINSKYGTSYENLTIDDVNYYNTNHYYISAELFNADAVNRLIWFSFLSSNLDCDFDSFMLNRAILLSLGLTPMVDEIPYAYIVKYVPGVDGLTLEEVNEIMNDWVQSRGAGLTEDELRIAEVIKYNISFHDILNWRYGISLGRSESGSICMTLKPNSMKYQGVIDGCSSLGVELNTEMQYYAPTNEDVRVIVKDTPEFFEETYGKSYESVLEEYGLPINPEI